MFLMFGGIESMRVILMGSWVRFVGWGWWVLSCWVGWCIFWSCWCWCWLLWGCNLDWLLLCWEFRSCCWLGSCWLFWLWFFSCLVWRIRRDLSCLIVEWWFGCCLFCFLCCRLFLVWNGFCVDRVCCCWVGRSFL